VLPVAVGLALLVPGVGSRLASLADLNADPFAEVDYSLVERTAALEVRLAVFADNPALGVGPGNTSLVWTDYMTAAGTGITREVAAHNLYLEAAAESGVLGVLAWLLFLGGVVVIGLSHVRVHRVRGGAAVPIDRLLAVAVVAAVAGWAVASIFLHLAFFGTLLVVVAVLGAMRLELPAQPPPRDPDRLRVVGRRVLVGATVVAVAGAALGAVHLTQRERVWVAEVPISLVPVNEPGLPAADPYTQSVTSYTRTIATYAAVVDAVGRPLVRDRDDVTMSVVGTGAEAVFAVRVESTDRRAAQQAALRVARAGDAFVDASPGLTALASTQLGRPTLASDERSPLSLP
jgi:O-antigen ligase